MRFENLLEGVAPGGPQWRHDPVVTREIRYFNPCKRPQRMIATCNYCVLIGKEKSFFNIEGPFWAPQDPVHNVYPATPQSSEQVVVVTISNFHRGIGKPCKKTIDRRREKVSIRMWNVADYNARYEAAMLRAHLVNSIFDLACREFETTRQLGACWSCSESLCCSAIQ